jgi:hypothetical protein
MSATFTKLSFSTVWPCSKTCLGLVFILIAMTTYAQAPLVSLQDGRLVYNKYANRGQTNLVNQIPDFSNAGYKGGGIRIPELPVRETLTAVQGDCRQLIQDAIDRVSALTPDANGYRGAVLLKAGIYRVEGSLMITASGVVLRGEGNLVDGTVLIATQKTQHNFIVLQGSGSGYAEVSGSKFRIASAYVPTGTKILEVVAGHSFQVGDKVVLQKTPNDAWITVLNMAQYGWTASAYRTTYERQIVGVAGNQLTLDIPVMDPIETQYGGGEVYKSAINGRINNCGVENMRIESSFASSTDESHGWNAVFLNRVENSWVRQVIAKYFGFGAVNVTNMSRYNTIEDCGMIDPKSQTTGGRKYSFNLETNSTNNFFQRCMTWGGRHDYVSGSKVPGPNVFLDCVADNTFDDIGPHHRYSTGQLYDNVYGGAIRVQNRGASGSGHGWSGAQILFWNCRSYKNDIEVESPPTARSWGIGCVGLTQTNTGYWESWGVPVLPRSLYLQQLQERLGASAVAQITTADQINNVLRQRLIDRGRLIAAEPPVGILSGNIAAFDLTDNGGVLTAQYTTTSRPDQTYDKIIDNNFTTAYYQSGRTALWVQYRSTVSAIVTRYTITSSFEVDARDPVDWNLQGSNNGTSWTTLDTRTGEDFPTRSLTRMFQVNNTLSFIYYRLNITKNAGNANTQFNEWELFQRKQQLISIGEITDVTYGDDPVELVVSAGSELPVSLAVLSGPGLIVDNNFLRIDGAGSIVIRVTQAGDENYFPATRDYTVIVNKAAQTIALTAPSTSGLEGDPAFDLDASSTSGLPVTISSSNPSVASLSGNTVTINAPGTVTFTASQGGDANFNAAPAATLAFTVTALPAPAVTANGPVSFCPGGSVVLTSSEAISYQWLLNGSTINQSAQSFTATSSGSYSVEVTYSNGGRKTSGPIAIVVEDVTAPNVSAKNITIQLSAAGNASITEDAVNNGSTDACGGLTFDTDITSFDCTNVGPNTVTLTVTDANGNTGTGTATVTVEDQVKPTVSTQNITVQLSAAGTASITEDAVNNGSTDACGGLTFDTDITSFNCTNVGPNTVTLTVTDANGNTGTGTATVTVEDKVKPTVITQNITVQLNAAGTATITEDAVNNSSTDACGGLTFDTDITSFNCTNVGANTVTLTVTDANGNTSTGTATVTVEDKVKPIAVCRSITVNLGLDGTVAVSPQQIDNGSGDACGAVMLSTNISLFSTANVGPNNVILTVTDKSGNSSSCTAIVTVAKRPTILLYTGDGTEQYSDKQGLVALLTDQLSGTPLANKPIRFDLGAQNISGSTNLSGVVSELLTVAQNPALSFKVASHFAGDAIFLASSDLDDFDILQEDARVDYTGIQFIATACATCSTATIQLRASVQDISVPTTPADPLYDAYPGDVRNAKVKFVNRETNTDISGWLDVTTLIDPSDLRTGTVTFSHNVTLTSNETGRLMTVGMIVDNGYYIRNNSIDNTVITVYKPVSEFITGGGYIIPTESFGAYSSDPGIRSNFGVNVKYNKSGGQPKGNVNIIFRKTVGGVLRTYQVKSNAINSVGIGGDDALKMGQFISKANLTDITDPLSVISLGGNLDLNITMSDRGEPGSQDAIGVTLYGTGGNLWYSSKWVVYETVEQPLAAGNIVIKGANVGTASAPSFRYTNAGTPELKATDDEYPDLSAYSNVTAYPNPSSNQFTLNIPTSKQKNVVIKVTDVAGTVKEIINNVTLQSNISIGSNYPPGTYFVEIHQGEEKRRLKLIKL